MNSTAQSSGSFFPPFSLFPLFFNAVLARAFVGRRDLVVVTDFPPPTPLPFLYPFPPFPPSLLFPLFPLPSSACSPFYSLHPSPFTPFSLCPSSIRSCFFPFPLCDTGINCWELAYTITHARTHATDRKGSRVTVPFYYGGGRSGKNEAYRAEKDKQANKQTNTFVFMCVCIYVRSTFFCLFVCLLKRIEVRLREWTCSL